jgi:FolB domain-containing protein
MGTIRIQDLALKAIIGINDWERRKKQKIIINIEIEYDASKAIRTDHIKYALDYKSITKEIIKKVEKSEFLLLEKLTAFILNLVMKHRKIRAARVRVDKPGALRFSRSVSFELSKKRRT